jgi:hypothetical protein
MTRVSHWLSLAIAAGAISCGCCPSATTSPQVINTAPLEAADVPPDIASILPLFPERTETIVSGGRHRDGSLDPGDMIEWVRLTHWVGWGVPGLDVEVRLYRSEDSAHRDFHEWLDAAHWKYALRGVRGNLCAVSDWERSRVGADAPFSCAHGLPSSFVSFQKGRVVVFIGETSPEPNSGRKEAVIARLATILSRGSGAPTTSPGGGAKPHEIR